MEQATNNKTSKIMFYSSKISICFVAIVVATLTWTHIVNCRPDFNTLYKQIFDKNAPVLDKKKTHDLLKSLDSVAPKDSVNSKTGLARKELDALLGASVIATNLKCVPDMFGSSYNLLMNRSTYRLVNHVYSDVSVEPWNENIKSYLQAYHDEQYADCHKAFEKEIKKIKKPDSNVLKFLMEHINVEDSSQSVLVKKEDIHSGLLDIVELSLSKEGKQCTKKNADECAEIYMKDFQWIYNSCKTFTKSLTKNYATLMNWFFLGYMKSKVAEDMFLIDWVRKWNVCSEIIEEEHFDPFKPGPVLHQTLFDELVARY